MGPFTLDQRCMSAELLASFRQVVKLLKYLIGLCLDLLLCYCRGDCGYDCDFGVHMLKPVVVWRMLLQSLPQLLRFSNSKCSVLVVHFSE